MQTRPQTRARTPRAPSLWIPPLLLLLSLASGAPAAAGPKADLWEHWSAHDEGSEERVDHGAWETFLQRYVVAAEDGVHRVRYGSVSDADRRALDAYLEGLSATPVTGLSRAEQKAFWINLYNALTIQVILDHHPVSGIREISISPGFFSIGPWGKKLVEVEGEPVSLDDIEHRILRPIWRDPRIHYAVNCASIGCPNLRRRAFTAENSDALLELGAREYVNHPRGIRVENGRVTASSIYDWFESDFGGGEPEVLDHVRRFAEPALRAELEGLRRIARYRYDWSLNDAPAE